MKTPLLVLATLIFSSISAFADYDCQPLSKAPNRGFSLNISADKKTLTFSGLITPADSVTRNPKLDSKSGYEAFSGLAGCVPKPGGPAVTCGAVRDVLVQLSEQLLNNAVQADLIADGNTFRCHIEMSTQE